MPCRPNWAVRPRDVDFQENFPLGEFAEFRPDFVPRGNTANGRKNAGGAGMIWASAAAVIWLVSANLIALPTCVDRRRRLTMGLVMAGIPILGWLTLVAGPVWAGLALALGCAMLRWPLPRLATASASGARKATLQEPAE